MPKDKKDQSKKVQMKVFFWEAVLFSLTLFLGIVTAFRLNEFLEIQKISVPAINPWRLILSFLIATLFILTIPFLIKSKSKKGAIFKALFVFVIFFGGIITLDLWLGDILALVLMGYLVFLWLKKPSVFVHNLCIILGIAGVGASLGLRLDPLMVAGLLIVFSIYDFIAVYKTKHMVKMAKEMIEHQAILALVIPREAAGFKGELKGIKAGGKFLILGGGDIAFPLLLCASLIPRGIVPSLIVAVFSLIGLLLSYLIFTSQKIKKPIPALPPITLFSVLGFSITFLL